MNTHLDAYLEDLRGANKSDLTIHAYRHKIKQFLEWLGDRPVTRQTLQGYRLHRQGEGRRPRTIRCDFTAIFAFFAWLEANGYAEDLPRRGAIVLPRMDEAQRETPTDDEVARFFAEAMRMPAHTERKKYLRGRALAIVTILAFAGLRRAELLALNVSDIQTDTAPWRLRVRCGKGAQTRWLPLSSEAQTHLREWMEIRKKWCADHGHTSDALFPVDRNRRLAHRALDSVWAELLEVCGMGASKITPHSFRHWFGTRTAGAVDLPTAQKLLGHKRLETTFQYLHTNAEKMQEAVESLTILNRYAQSERQKDSQPAPAPAPERPTTPQAPSSHRGAKLARRKVG